LHIIVITVVILLILALLLRSNRIFTVTVFVVTVQNGKIANSKGNISQTLIQDLTKTIGNVGKGEIIGHRDGKTVHLKFRGDIDDFTQQRIRNIVGLYY